MPWIVSLDDMLFVSTTHFLGPHLWNEPGAECWSYPDNDDEPLGVPPGCYHASMSREDAHLWPTRAEALRVAEAVSAADPHGDVWRPAEIATDSGYPGQGWTATDDVPGGYVPSSSPT